MSRSGENITARYPETHPIGRALGSTEVVLDGEIVALDDKGRPSFEEIQQRMGLTSETEIRRKMKEVPVTYMVFDLMWQDGHSLVEEPYTGRRKTARGLEAQGRRVANTALREGRGRGDARGEPEGGARGHHGQEAGLAYEPGRRSGLWVKVKNRWARSW